MEDNVKSRYALCLGVGKTPESLPKHFVEFYDGFLKAYGAFNSVRDRMDRNLDPLFAHLCELFHEQSEKIAELTDRLAVLETEPTVKTSAPPIDWRTKEGRALKAQTQAVGA